ncbi:MAG: multidrug efflux SMR transporter [Gemmataceae bacterium]
MTSWGNLFVAGVLEVTWAIGLKYADGWTKFWPSVFTIAGMVASFYFLARAIVTIPVGTAYAVWTGIGAVGTAMFGVILFGEHLTLARVACLLLIVTGIIGLRMTSSH